MPAKNKHRNDICRTAGFLRDCPDYAGGELNLWLVSESKPDDVKRRGRFVVEREIFFIQKNGEAGHSFCEAELHFSSLQRAVDRLMEKEQEARALGMQEIAQRDFLKTLTQGRFYIEGTYLAVPHYKPGTDIYPHDWDVMNAGPLASKPRPQIKARKIR